MNSHQEAGNSFVALEPCRARDITHCTMSGSDGTAGLDVLFAVCHYFRAFVQTARRREKHSITGGKSNIPFSRQTVGA